MKGLLRDFFSPPFLSSKSKAFCCLFITAGVTGLTVKVPSMLLSASFNNEPLGKCWQVFLIP